MTFSRKAQTILNEAGWRPDRFTDINTYVRVLQQEGYTIFPIIQQFLVQFGGIEVTLKEDVRSQKITRVLHFNADTAAEAVYNEGYISVYAQRIGRPLCVIGECDNDNTTLLMDSQGAVYGGFDNRLVLFGHTVEEAISNIFDNKFIAVYSDN